MFLHLESSTQPITITIVIAIDLPTKPKEAIPMLTLKGTLSAVMFEDGETKVECDLEECECPVHEEPPLPAGTYVTVKLPIDVKIPLSREVEITWLK